MVDKRRKEKQAEKICTI